MIDRSEASTPEAVLDREGRRRNAAACDRGIAAAFREVLVLREIEELSYREISDIMSIPIGTVMSRLARARSLLIQRIGMAGSGKAGTA